MVDVHSSFPDEYLPLSADAYHAEAFILAYINSLKGANSYLLSFDLENHTNHANDLTFFFGLHPVQGRNMTPEERLMDAYEAAVSGHVASKCV